MFKNLWWVPRAAAAAAVVCFVVCPVAWWAYGWRVGVVYLAGGVGCVVLCRAEAAKLRRHRNRMRILRWSSTMSGTDLGSAVRTAPLVSEKTIDSLWEEDADVVHLWMARERRGA